MNVEECHIIIRDLNAKLAIADNKECDLHHALDKAIARCDPQAFIRNSYLIKVYLDHSHLRDSVSSETFSEFLQMVGSISTDAKTNLYHIAKYDYRLLYAITGMRMCKNDDQYTITLRGCPALLQLCRNYADDFELLDADTMEPIKHQTLDVNCEYKSIVTVCEDDNIYQTIIDIVYGMVIDKRIAEKSL